MTVNRQWIVVKRPRPKQLPDRTHLELRDGAVPVIAEGQFLLRTICLGTSPAQRAYVSGGVMPQKPVEPGEVMRGRGVGVVVESRHPDYREGDIVVASTGWQDYSLQEPREDFVWSVGKVAYPVAPLTTALGILGNAGATAWFGLHEGAQFKPGDSVVITAAAGGVGSVAGQIARLSGAKTVIGITGSDDKASWLRDELGFDAVINYRDEDVASRLAALCPGGIDVCLDNVGGPILDAVLANLAVGARVAIAGFVATEYESEPQSGPINYRNLVAQRATMRGFVVFDYWERYHEAIDQLYQWHCEGLLVNCEDVIEGLENMPEALADLFAGRNRGIRSVRVAPDPAGLIEQDLGL